MQTRNVIVFSACTCLQYMAGPLLYVGPQQGALCESLGASPLVANLPEAAFYLMVVTPAFLAWWLPDVAFLRRMLFACYLAAAAALALVALLLVVPAATEIKVAAVVLQGAVIGATIPTAIALLWEAIGRGAAESRRGLALSLAFGIGPFLAFGTSLVAQELLKGTLWGVLSAPIEPPWNSVAVFGSGVPLLVAAALASRALVIPPAAQAPIREPIWSGLRDFLKDPLLAKATIVTVILYLGNAIPTNMNLYTKYVLTGNAQSFVNYQYAIRFGCKGIAGALLGWVLSRSNPRAGIVITAILFIAAPLWALSVPGVSYLLAFGIFGAGELVGVFAPNYIVSASSPERLRQNLAYVTMMMAPTSAAGFLFGAIAAHSGLNQAGGLRASFAVCAAILTIGLVLAVALLPKQPQPERQIGESAGAA